MTKFVLSLHVIRNSEQLHIIDSKNFLLEYKQFMNYNLVNEIFKDMKKIKYNKETDAIFIELSDKQIDYVEDEGQFIVHFTKKGEPVLIEIFDAREFTINLLSSVIKGEEVAMV